MKNFLITGGLGFIGSHFVVEQVKNGNKVVNLDKVTYAANKDNVKAVEGNSNYHFVKGDIADCDLIYEILQKHDIDYVVNFAAESHVDNSINCAHEFIQTNIVGTFQILEASRKYHENIIDEKKKGDFRFLHVSTDEVFGSLSQNDDSFTENNKYLPNSPYSASKASSDHLVRAWHKTYSLPVIITNCSNNYGPNQHHEKLIPTIIKKATLGQKIPIYGNGKNIRDWIYVTDHCKGIYLALTSGKIGQTYCFGGEYEVQNIEIANKICEILDEIRPLANNNSYKEQIEFVQDRKGHDFRYAINNKKAKEELGFEIKNSFDENLRKIIKAII